MHYFCPDCHWKYQKRGLPETLRNYNSYNNNSNGNYNGLAVLRHCYLLGTEKQCDPKGTWLKTRTSESWSSWLLNKLRNISLWWRQNRRLTQNVHLPVKVHITVTIAAISLYFLKSHFSSKIGAAFKNTLSVTVKLFKHFSWKVLISILH